MGKRITKGAKELQNGAGNTKGCSTIVRKNYFRQRRKGSLNVFDRGCRENYSFNFIE